MAWAAACLPQAVFENSESGESKGNHTRIRLLAEGFAQAVREGRTGSVYKGPGGKQR